MEDKLLKSCILLTEQRMTLLWQIPDMSLNRYGPCQGFHQRFHEAERKYKAYFQALQNRCVPEFLFFFFFTRFPSNAETLYFHQRIFQLRGPFRHIFAHNNRQEFLVPWRFRPEPCRL